MAQKLNIDIIARDKSKQALGNVQKGLARVKNSVFNLRNAFLGLGAGLVIRNLVNTGKQLENLRTRLKFLLKNTNEGAKAFENMTKFASKVPFSLEQIQSGAGILATVTDNADDLQKMLEITGNVAAVTGLDFRTASEQIQRSFSAGIGAADLFREKGVRNMLGFKAGATVSIEETVQAFERVFARGGRFGQATDELAQTFEGTLSMIGDKVFNFKKVLLEAGFFDELKRQFGDLDKFLEDNAKDLEKIAVAVGKNLAQGMVKVVQIGKDLIPTLQNIGKILKSIGDGFMALPPYIRTSGIIGAFLFGKKGLVALAGVSLFVDKVQDLIAEAKIRMGIFDLENINSVDAKIKSIKTQLNEIETQKVMATMEGENIDTTALDKRIFKLSEELSILEDHRKTLQNINKIQLESNHHMFEMGNGAIRVAENIKQVTKFTSVSNHHMFEMANAVDKTNKTFREMNETVLKNLEKKFENVSTTIKEGINSGITKMSQGLARAFVFGEKLSDTLKSMAQNVLANIISSLIEVVARKGVELAIEKMITNEKRKQIALQGASFFGSFSSAFGMRASGGSVQKGQPYIVGERGAELFVPNQSGQIQQSARGTNGGATTVNFNINTVDASGFEELLVRSRGTITQLINNAVNERGSKNLI